MTRLTVLSPRLFIHLLAAALSLNHLLIVSASLPQTYSYNHTLLQTYAYHNTTLFPNAYLFFGGPNNDAETYALRTATAPAVVNPLPPALPIIPFQYIWPSNPQNASDPDGLRAALLAGTDAAWNVSVRYECYEPGVSGVAGNSSELWSTSCNAMAGGISAMEEAGYGPGGTDGQKLTAGVVYLGYDQAGRGVESFVHAEVLAGSEVGKFLALNGGGNCTDWIGSLAALSGDCDVDEDGTRGGYHVVAVGGILVRFGIENKWGLSVIPVRQGG